VKRIISISFIAVSTFILLILVIIPHHHHDGVACWVMERCEQDGNINDEHTKHNHSAEDATRNQSCFAENEYTIPRSSNEIKSKVSSCDTHSFPIFFLIADLFIFHEKDSVSKMGYGDYFSCYKSTEANQFNSLRAPPVILS